MYLIWYIYFIEEELLFTPQKWGMGDFVQSTNHTESIDIELGNQHNRRMNINRKILVSALSLFLVISIPTPGNTISLAPDAQVSEVKISAGLKDDYLNRICKNNLLSDIFYNSYSSYVSSTYSGSFVNESKNRFIQDGNAVQKHNNSLIKWLKKNKLKFKKSTRKHVQTYIDGAVSENNIISAMLNANSIDALNFEWDNYIRNSYSMGDASGKIRKSLKLPTREGNAGCP
jgi:hypothetical protein